MRTINLTRGQVATVDDEDFELVSQFKWYAFLPVNKSTFYAARRKGKTGEKMHRLIMNAKPGEEVDHKDGNGLNNCRSNLRIATRNQNQQNIGPQKRNKSGFKGVTFRPYRKSGPYEANIFKNGKAYYLGMFMDAASAAEAYNRAAKELFGEFARLNVIPKRFDK